MIFCFGYYVTPFKTLGYYYSVYPGPFETFRGST